MENKKIKKENKKMKLYLKFIQVGGMGWKKKQEYTSQDLIKF